MADIKNMKIGTKILGMLGIILGLMVLVAGFGIVKISSVGDEIKVVAEENIPLAASISRVKASRAVQSGDTLEITLGADTVTVTVRSLPSRRGPAPEARRSYEETADSAARRERHREQRRLTAMTAPQTPGRPDKGTRRELLRFHRNQGGS